MAVTNIITGLPLRMPGPILVTALAACLIIVILYRGYSHRRFHRDLPGPPHSWLFEIFYLDLWPIDPGMVVITDPKLMGNSSRPKPLPIHPLTAVFMKPMLGEGTMAATNGALWRKIATAVSQTFSMGHVLGMTSITVDECLLFQEKLDELAVTGDVFSMEELIARLVFGMVSIDLRELVNLAGGETNPLIAYNPMVQTPRRWKRHRIVSRLDRSLRQKVNECVERIVQEGDVPSRQNPRSIMDLLIREHAEAMLEERKGGFLFMLLSKTPDVVEKMHREHIEQLGASPTVTLLDNPSILRRLPYTEAVIKESPRLYPLGSDLKQAPPGTTITTHDGRRLPNANGLIMTASTHTIHYDANIYPDRTSFRPERWIDPEKAPTGPGYFRAFGGDGRTCPGQNMGMNILKIVMVITMGKYTFDCAGLAPNKEPRTKHTNFYLVFGDTAFQQLGLDGRPGDGMMMTVGKKA
ncbi:cytochrome P450 [Fusarium oxysporum f. sp. albedinis]|nr:cytochrome P450 [Fusarium oxysporum f. sp. albedinis]